jgi:hypothetical protein
MRCGPLYKNERCPWAQCCSDAGTCGDQCDSKLSAYDGPAGATCKYPPDRNKPACRAPREEHEKLPAPACGPAYNRLCPWTPGVDLCCAKRTDTGVHDDGHCIPCDRLRELPRDKEWVYDDARDGKRWT